MSAYLAAKALAKQDNKTINSPPLHHVMSHEIYSQDIHELGFEPDKTSVLFHCAMRQILYIPYFPSLPLLYELEILPRLSAPKCSTLLALPACLPRRLSLI